MQIKLESTLIMPETWQLCCWIMSCLSQIRQQDTIFTCIFSRVVIMFFPFLWYLQGAWYIWYILDIISKIVVNFWYIYEFILVWENWKVHSNACFGWSIYHSIFFTVHTHNFMQLLQKWICTEPVFCFTVLYGGFD